MHNMIVTVGQYIHLVNYTKQRKNGLINLIDNINTIKMS